MDDFFPEELQVDLRWFDVGPVNNPSSFVPYRSSEIGEGNSVSGSNPTNINKKMIEFMRTRSYPGRIEAQESESRSCYRRMMNERLRRDREKQGYLLLHSLLPLGTKNDKKSIIQTAAKSIQELKRQKEELEMRNFELEAKLGEMGIAKASSTKIGFSVANPASGLDCMVEALQCLKKLGSKTTFIQAKFSDQQLVTVMGIETQVEAGLVEKAVQRTLEDAEKRKLASASQNERGNQPPVL